MTKPKVLFVASVSEHMIFHYPYLKWFQENGFETHVAAAHKQVLPCVDVFWEVDFKRSPFSPANIIAYRQLKKILNAEKFAIISTHTPMASILSRLANRSVGFKDTKLVYMAHGFHFYKGAPLINWLIYYPIEIIFSRFTHTLICINKEDYFRIKENGSKKCQYFLVPGVGVPSAKFNAPSVIEKQTIRERLHYSNEKVLVIYAAEFIPRKNHQFIIDAVCKHKDVFANAIFLFAGKGPEEEKLKQLVLQNKTADIIQFIGFRKDIADVYKMADIGVSASRQEGLPINIVEELQTGLPVVCTNIRGQNELVVEATNGFLFTQNDTNAFVKKMELLLNDANLRHKMGLASLELVKPFILENAFAEITKIYQDIILSSE